MEALFTHQRKSQNESGKDNGKKPSSKPISGSHRFFKAARVVPCLLIILTIENIRFFKML